MAPHADFDSTEVRDKARRDLLHLLETVRGKKNLVIEKSLAGPIGTIAKVSTLQDYGVDKFFFLENGNTDTSQRNIVFVAHQIRRLQRESQTGHDFYILWVPRRTLVSDAILEEAGVFGDVSIHELPLYFFPLEDDVLSLELDDTFKDLYLTKDPTAMFLLAKALMEVQQRHGLFPRIIGKGDNAKRVAELLARFRQELLAGEDASEVNRIDLIPSTTTESVIIIDREVDPVTPLLTQLTYEGLIDEIYGIQNSQTDVDSTIVGASAAATGTGSGSSTSTPVLGVSGARKRKIQLDSSDKLYEELRDANFAVVGGLLNKVARRLQSDYEGRHSTRTTAELRDFVNKLPGYQAEQASLKVHAGLVEEIYNYTRSDEFSSLLEVQQNLAAGADPSAQFDAIEELIARDTSLNQILRLLCIYSCISGGIKPKEYDQFRRLILEGYGYQHLLTLQNLETLQMFLPRSSPLAGMIPMAGSAGATGTKTNYTFLRKQLRLIVDEVSEHDPNDIAYVYSGYAPLSVRKTVFVVFVGGITFTEIAALRFVARKEEGRRNIVICTTSIVSGNKMMAAAVEAGSFKRDAGLDVAAV
ncbi:Vacuolar protein-sorting-associated protein 33 [Sporothrix curviconia]|uniref:Vacuolar protein-sorting-associated protein 33 n=1 Tax=Sporothrix curviconia TaxID=1260050 RepID=A0ABP0BJZ5_9PEZI